MKKLTSLLAMVVLSISGAVAQDLNQQTTTSSAQPNGADVTGFKAPLAPGLSSSAAKTPPNPHPDLKPKAGGIFVDGPKYGWVMISPGAPASYGMGEKYLSAPSSRADLQHESAYAAHRETGGFKLFSLEF